MLKKICSFLVLWLWGISSLLPMTLFFSKNTALEHKWFEVISLFLVYSILTKQVYSRFKPKVTMIYLLIGMLLCLVFGLEIPVRANRILEGLLTLHLFMIIPLTILHLILVYDEKN